MTPPQTPDAGLSNLIYEGGRKQSYSGKRMPPPTPDITISTTIREGGRRPPPPRPERTPNSPISTGIRSAGLWSGVGPPLRYNPNTVLGADPPGALRVALLVVVAIIGAPVLAWLWYFAIHLPIWAWYASLYPPR